MDNILLICYYETAEYSLWSKGGSFESFLINRFPTPCHQCVVMENGKLSTCGRCIEVPGLCERCGYFFVAEYTLLFRGNPRIIIEMLRT